jgi:hypothetical protein
VRAFHHLCVAFFEGGGMDFVLALLSSSPPPNAVAPSLSFVTDPLLFSSLLPRSSFFDIPPPPDLLASPDRYYLVAFHPQPLRHSRFYSGSRIRFSLGLICHPSFLPSSDASCHLVLRPSSFPPLLPSSPSDNHAPMRGSHALPRVL